ncbi:hypothetical protein [Vibrio sp. F13]|nr:hypothetical protein [Vibrio sp. F13]
MNDKRCIADRELSITNNDLEALNCVLRNLDLGLTETELKGD